MPKSVPYTSTQPISQSKLFFSSRRRHTSCGRDWSSDVCSSDLLLAGPPQDQVGLGEHRGDALTHREGIRVEIGRASCRERVLLSAVGEVPKENVTRARGQSQQQQAQHQVAKNNFADAEERSVHQHAAHQPVKVVFFKQKTAYELRT